MDFGNCSEWEAAPFEPVPWLQNGQPAFTKEQLPVCLLRLRGAKLLYFYFYFFIGFVASRSGFT